MEKDTELREKAINTLKAIGTQPDPEKIAQLVAFFKSESKKNENSNTESSISEASIWETLQANYPYGVMPEEKKKCVEETVEKLLETGETAEEPGLLLGKIQCGKTDTFEDIIGLAFDKGVDIAIVITKGTKALVNQTIKRMKHDYRFFKASDRLEQKNTINIYDIMDVWHNLKQAKVEGCKTVIVSKKNAKNLDHLIDLFEKNSPYLKKKKVLIVDDEADFASRNYRSVKLNTKTGDNGNTVAQKKGIDLAKISQQIDDFRKIPEFCRYLQVTATPYCLYLQPENTLNLNGNIVKPFKPRFTSLVPIHDRYIGGKQYFEESQDSESMYSHLFHQIDQKCMDVLGHEDQRYLNAAVSSGNIYGLTYALVAYFMATAVRRIQMRAEGKDYKTSAVIHAYIDKKNHDWQKRVVNRLIESIRDAILKDDQTDQRIWLAIDSIYGDFTQSNEKGRNAGLIDVELPSKEEIMDEIRKIFDPRKHNYHVQMVNSDEQMEALLDEETGELTLDTAATIFIGGNILDRGVTIKNMLCFFYGRNPKNFQQDTVLQHARMYGSRPKEDMAVMRFHTTALIHKIFARMNELDEQLRQWFIEGKDQEEPNAVFVGYDDNIRPCATQKIKVSNAIMLKKQQRILPVGFWTGTKTAIGKITQKIDSIIELCPHYTAKDANGFFEIDKATVMEILRLIESTYVYGDKYFNTDRKNDIKEMLCALEYCTAKTDDKLYALHRTNRNMSRIRENGCFVDAPHDGRTELTPSREKAIDKPVIMLFRQNGEKQIKDGENIGWNNAPFYWPVLLTQENLQPVMYALDQSKKDKIVITDGSILDGIDPKDVLKLTFKGNLEDHFGKEGTEYTDEDYKVETRSLKESTASRYIEKDENGDWVLNPDVPFDKEHDQGLYSRNNEMFPFVLRPYKYILLRNGRDAKADAMLLELADMSLWETYAYGELNKDGDLLDRDTHAVLMHGSDTIISKDMRTKEVRDETITQWVIEYAVKKVLKFQQYTKDTDAAFGEDDGEN
ncbi:MAG: hypothetical protein HUJ98_06345 [Bacteroidaceae bacterium]|nr:hypothetical protein [Bacteroidaceae bacterium]